MGRQIRLNHYGEALLRRVERASQELERVRREIADLASGDEGFIELAIHAGTQLLPDLLSAFRRQYPRIRFRVSQLNAPEAFEQLERGVVDLCIYMSTSSAAGHRERSAGYRGGRVGGAT